MTAAGEAFLDQAQKLAKDSAAVDRARLYLRFLRLECSRVPGQDLDVFVEEARRLGITAVFEWLRVEDWAAEKAKLRK